ncbi:MAG: hypothetical protein QW330_00990, partial [Nitrososphaerota archaeon]
MRRGVRKLSLDVALLASFSALYMVVLKILPGIPAIGFPGVKIEIAIALSPIYGLILGHVLGPASLLIGTLMAMTLLPGKYTLFNYVTIFAAPLGALTSSLTFDRGRLLGIPKWVYAAGIYGVMLAFWYATDVGRLTAIFTIYYLAAVALVLASGILGSGGRIGRSALRILAGSASGVFADHLYGSLAAIIVFRYVLGSLEPEAMAAWYLAAIPVVGVERGIMIIFSFAVALNLYLLLRGSRYLRVRME